MGSGLLLMMAKVILILIGRLFVGRKNKARFQMHWMCPKKAKRWIKG